MLTQNKGYHVAVLPKIICYLRGMGRKKKKTEPNSTREGKGIQDNHDILYLCLRILSLFQIHQKTGYN